MPDVCLKRALARGGLDSPAGISMEMNVMSVYSELFCRIDPLAETPQSLNEAAKAVAKLGAGGRISICAAAAEYIRPGSAGDLLALAERTDLFIFYPGIFTPEEYGRDMIIESGRFEYDENLDGFYDFEGYGRQRMENEQGWFAEGGYISYGGDEPLEVIFPHLKQPPGPDMIMGGM